MTPPALPSLFIYDCGRCGVRVEEARAPQAPAPGHFGKPLCRRCADHYRAVDGQQSEPDAPRPARRPLPTYELLERRAREKAPEPATDEAELDALGAEARKLLGLDDEPAPAVPEPEPPPQEKELPMPATKAPVKPKCRLCVDPERELFAAGLCQRCYLIEKKYGPEQAKKAFQARCDQCGEKRKPNTRGAMPTPGLCFTCAREPARSSKKAVAAPVSPVAAEIEAPIQRLPDPQAEEKAADVRRLLEAAKTCEPTPAPRVAPAAPRVLESTTLAPGLERLRTPPPRAANFPEALAAAIVEVGHQADELRARLREHQFLIESLERVGNEIAARGARAGAA